MYLCIHSGRRSDTIMFHHQGGVDVGDVDALAIRLDVRTFHTFAVAFLVIYSVIFDNDELTYKTFGDIYSN